MVSPNLNSLGAGNIRQFTYIFYVLFIKTINFKSRFIIIMNPKQFLENRSVQLIFRDCLKLASRMVKDPNKVVAVRALIRK